MVRANEEVAKFITDLKLPMMYRIHEVPKWRENWIFYWCIEIVKNKYFIKQKTYNSTIISKGN
nr:hypothetical protein [Mycoplasmopsis bovis]